MKIKATLVGLIALAASAVAMPSAMAMPNGLPQAQQLSNGETNIEQVRWVCNPWGRCWLRPNLYGAYAFYPPPPPRVYFRRPCGTARGATGGEDKAFGGPFRPPICD